MTIDQHTCVEGGEAEEVTVTTELELEPEERTYSFIVYSFIVYSFMFFFFSIKIEI